MFIELPTFYKFRILSTCKNKLEYLACAPRRRCLGSIDIGIDCSIDMILSLTRNWKIIMFIELPTFYKFRILSTCKNKLEHLACSCALDVLVLLTLPLDLDVLVLLTLPLDMILSSRGVVEIIHVYRAHKFL